MDWINFPPLTALRAFSALAETGSVNAAGAALNVSHAAVSQQIKALESHLHLSLVDRKGRNLELTEDGRKLSEVLSEGFEQIASVIDTLTGAEANRPLHIATTPMFAAHWLMPQLADFHICHPEVNLTLSTTPKVEPISTGGVDVALRYGDGDWPGLVSEPMFRSPMVVVAAPALVGEEEFQSIGELAVYPWLLDAGISEANNWLSGIGQLTSLGQGSIQLPGNLLLDGARDGQGVAVIIRKFVEKDLASGRLRRLFESDQPKGYHIVTRPGVHRPSLKAFLKWLRGRISD